MSDRLEVTLSPGATAAVKRMESAMNAGSPAEVVRRGLILLDLLLNLSEHECLGVVDKNTGRVEQLRFAWDTL